MHLKTIKEACPDRVKHATHKFYIFNRGGLGDTIRKYFDKDDGWEYLTSLKKKYPKALIKLIVLSGNPQTAHFYKYHPQLDFVIQGSWAHPHIPCKIINQIKGNNYHIIDKSLTKDLKIVKQTKLYLSDDDKKIVNRIKSKGPYVVLHPFAGEKTRRIMPIKEYFPLINTIARNGFNIVIVGANWTRGKTMDAPHKVNEVFPYKHKKLINLIDKVNPRGVAGLVLNSACLISVRSFCFALTKTEAIKSVLLVSDGKDKNRTYLGIEATKANMLAWGWSKDNMQSNIRIIGANTAKYDQTRREIISALKNLTAKH